MEALGRFELPTCGLGNRRSIHLSYRANTFSLFLNVLGVLRLRSGFRQRARTPANRLNLGNRRSIHLSYRATYTHYICGQEMRPSLIWIPQIPVFVSLLQQSTRSEQVHELFQYFQTQPKRPPHGLSDNSDLSDALRDAPGTGAPCREERQVTGTQPAFLAFFGCYENFAGDDNHNLILAVSPFERSACALPHYNLRRPVAASHHTLDPRSGRATQNPIRRDGHFFH